MEKEIKNKSEGGRKSRWQILFVDDRGKIITIKWFKPFSLTILSALLVSIISCIVLFFLFQSTQKKNQGLLNEIDKCRTRIESIRIEKDILMARLVIAESKINNLEKEKNKEEELKKTKPPVNQTMKNKAKIDKKEKNQYQTDNYRCNKYLSRYFHNKIICNKA